MKTAYATDFFCLSSSKESFNYKLHKVEIDAVLEKLSKKIPNLKLIYIHNDLKKTWLQRDKDCRI